MRTEMNQTRNISFEEIDMYMRRARTMRSAAIADMSRAFVRAVSGLFKSAKPVVAPEVAEVA
ncbi:MAG: RSP_7527 family protein [Pikeienuella sp.]